MRKTLIAVALLSALAAWRRESALEARRQEYAHRRALAMAGGDS